MLNLALTGDQAVFAELDRIDGRMRREIGDEVTALVLELQAHIVHDKLSGQVLNQRTGALARSIQEEAPLTEGDRIYGRVFSAGDVKYAAFWEFGFHGAEQVRAHTRTANMVFGKEVAPFVQNVRAHTRQVDQAARSFMRSALADMAPAISTRLKAAAVRGAIGE